jgi:hypothetical protein
MTQIDNEKLIRSIQTVFSDVSYRLAELTHPHQSHQQLPFSVADNYLARELAIKLAREIHDPSLLRYRRMDTGAKSHIMKWMEEQNQGTVKVIREIILKYVEQWLRDYQCKSSLSRAHRCRVLDAAEISEFISDVKSFLGNPATTETRNPFKAMHDLLWSEVSIVFVTNESVRVSARKESRNYNYTELGFADGRKADMHDTHWGLLRGIAYIEGKIPANQSGILDLKSRGKTEKQLQRIRKQLKDFFNISNNPIPVKKGKLAEFKYETEFKMSDERPAVTQSSYPDQAYESNGDAYHDEETGDYIHPD